MVNLISDSISRNSISSTSSVKTKLADDNKATNNSTNEVVQSEGKDNKCKFLVPLGLMGSGGLLIYYGLKKPNAVKFIRNLLNERMTKMEQQVADFYSASRETVRECFSGVPAHIEAYKQERWLDISPFAQNIKQSENMTDFVKSYTSAFDAVDNEIAKNRRTGACDFDVFKGFIHHIKKSAAEQIDVTRDRLNLIFSDYTYIPPFKDGGHEDIMAELQDIITSKSNSEKTSMWDFRNRILDLTCSEYSERMAETINTSRQLINDAKSSILDSAFAKVRQLLNLPEDFVPVYNKSFTTDNFAKLSSKELKPEILNNKSNSIFENSPLKYILENNDFSKMNEAKLKECFLRLTPDCTVEDIGIFIDRVRLQNVIDCPDGKPNEKMYNTIISKLEFLSAKLKETGKNEFIKKVQNTSFENLTDEQKHARMYYIVDIAKRLGLDSYEKINNYLTKNLSDYSQTSLSKLMEEVSLKPDFYFF